MPRPFLKWAGGKTQLLPQLEPLFPPAGSVRRYLEPFVGSGAVFLRVLERLRPGEVLLADRNEELINVYRAVRDDVEGLIRRLARHRKLHSGEHYYRTRDLLPAKLSPSARAARLVYLNRTCYNGLYRENRSGRFNVPMGRYASPKILDAPNLRAVSALLQGVHLEVAHFGRTPEFSSRGDFVYFDPPYQPLSRTASFTAYTNGSFTEEDQRQLAAVYDRLAGRGCRVMLSNSDVPLIRKIYSDYDIRKVEARRAINSRGDRRGPVGEVVVLNYAPP